VDTDHSPLASCPLRDAYHFSYINNSGGPCVYPASYVKPCASPSRLRFYFRECPSAAYTHEHGKTSLASLRLSETRNLAIDNRSRVSSALKLTKVTQGFCENVTVRWSAYGFLLPFHSNYGATLYHFPTCSQIFV